MLTDDQFQSITVSFRLTPVMAKVFKLLLEVPVATNSMIEACIDGDGTPAKLVIYRLRSFFTYTTIKIHKRNKVGYWLDDGTKIYVLRTLDSNIRHLVKEQKNDHIQGIVLSGTDGRADALA